MVMRRAEILGTGAGIAERRVTNDDLSKFVDTSDEWIRSRTGIRERRYVEEGTVTSDLCLEAANNAMEMAGVTADDLDLIIVGTASPDMLFPSTAAMLQGKLGTKGQMAFDISAACSGFIYSLRIANNFIATGQSACALVVGAETLSKVMNWQDRTTCVLFGDGAGAAVVGPTTEEGRGVLGSAAFADGSTWPLLNQLAGGSYMPASAETVEKNLHTLRMDGGEIFKIAVRSMLDMAEKALGDAGLTTRDVDLVIPHQANLRIIEAISKRLDLDSDKVFVNLDRFGNTSAASVPIALDEAVRGGLIKRGDKILLDAFGAGATAAAMVLGW